MRTRILSGGLWAVLVMLGALAWSCEPAVADEIPFNKFMYLDEGMTEGEVLLRVGPPDHEEVLENRFGAKERRIWYYIPQSKGHWLTVIHFNNAGKVVRIDRDRP